MTPVRPRHKIAAALALLYAGTSAPAVAQGDANWLCRVHWQEQTYGGDTLATTAVFEITRAAPQMDGSIFYMGRGNANIVFRPGGGCTAAGGGNATVNMTAMISSDDGETATVDIGPMGDDAFPVAVRCPYAHNSEMDVTASTPPSLTLPLQDGASASYDDSSRHSFGTVGGQRGTVRLEFCTPERRQQ